MSGGCLRYARRPKWSRAFLLRVPVSRGSAAGRRDKAIRLHGCLGDAQQHGAACGQRRRYIRRGLPTVGLEARAFFLVRLLADDLALLELRVAPVLDLAALLEPFVHLAEGEL